MSGVATAVVATAATSYYGSKSQARAAGQAADRQTASAEKGIEEQRREFDKLQKLLEPYVSAGNTALTNQMALIGLGGPEAEQAAIDRIQQGPTFAALQRQGEEAILQQASATGGLRGGNIQSALAQFRPNFLQQAIESQYQKLGGLTQLGQSSAAGVGGAGLQTGTNIASLLASQGQSQAQAALAQGQARANFYGDIGQLVGYGLGRGTTTNTITAGPSTTPNYFGI